jgi:hypothetical protein
MTQSIAEQPAPELAVPYSIDAEGKERPPPTLKELGARHRILFFYQHWCGGCHSQGFPTLQALVHDPRTEDDGVVLQDGFAIDVDRFIRAVTENGPTAQ